MSEESRFHQMLDADPSDQAARWLFGEWLLERGDDRADGISWMVACDKHPARDTLFTAGSHTWDWWSMLPGWNGGIGDTNDRSDRIDSALMRALSGYHRKSNWSSDCCYCEFRTRAQAEDSLCRAIHAVDRSRVRLVQKR